MTTPPVVRNFIDVLSPERKAVITGPSVGAGVTTGRPTRDSLESVNRGEASFGGITYGSRQDTNVSRTTLDKVNVSFAGDGGLVVTNNRNVEDDADTADIGEWVWRDGAFSPAMGDATPPAAGDAAFVEAVWVVTASDGGVTNAPPGADDYYFVTGFWYRGPVDYGVFVDGVAVTRDEDFPMAGTARYEGRLAGVYYADTLADNDARGDRTEGTVNGDLSFDVTFRESGGAPARPRISGMATNLRLTHGVSGTEETLENFNLEFSSPSFSSAWLDDLKAVRIGSVRCAIPLGSCRDVGRGQWNAQFFSLSDKAGRSGAEAQPEIFAGVWGIDNVCYGGDNCYPIGSDNPDRIWIDMLGTFETRRQ